MDDNKIVELYLILPFRREGGRSECLLPDQFHTRCRMFVLPRSFRQLFLHWCSVGRTRPAALSRRRETGSGQAPFLRCIFLSESYHVTSILYVDPSGNPIADDLHHLLLPDSDDRVIAVEGRFAGLNSRRDILVLINQAIRFMFQVGVIFKGAVGR